VSRGGKEQKMKIDQDIELAKRSAERMVRASGKKQDALWLGFMKRESTILLKRAMEVWWKLRFPGNRR